MTKNVQRNIYLNIENGRIRRCIVPLKKLTSLFLLSLFIFYFQFSSSFLSYCFILWLAIGILKVRQLDSFPTSLSSRLFPIPCIFPNFIQILLSIFSLGNFPLLFNHFKHALLISLASMTSLMRIKLIF